VPLEVSESLAPSPGPGASESPAKLGARVCAVSFKECWQAGDGRWFSTGGFPLQMRAIGSLFRSMTLVIVAGKQRPGGIPLPEQARVVALDRPVGADLRRKLSIARRLPRYVGAIAGAIGSADTVHVPLPGDIPFLGMWVAVFLRRRLIARYGGSWTSNSRSTFMDRVTRACMRSLAGGRNVMLATGEGGAPPADGMEWVFATALSRSEVDQIPAVSRGLSQPPRLVYVGRLSEEKGVSYLIEAMALLASGGQAPKARLTLVGDGPERPRLERLVVERGCAEAVAFAGQQNRTELSRILLESDVCVQPSLTEGFSKAWLDAMAHGVPVLASRVGAAESVIGDDGARGWLIPPGDSAALAAALRRVLTEPLDWKRLRQRCQRFAADRTLESWSARIGTICTRQWKSADSEAGGR